MQELRQYLADNPNFKADFQLSFNAALKSGIREFDDYSIKTFDDYIDWYEYLLGWVPSEQQDGQFVYHVLCLFYYVMNIPPLSKWTSPILPQTRAPYTWLSDWVIRYAKQVGDFMDSPDSITPYSLATFRNSPAYRMQDYPVPQGGWNTFNYFFARRIDLSKRPIDYPPIDPVANQVVPDTNKIIVSPADSVFDGWWPVNSNAECAIKGLPWPISELLDDQNSGGFNYGPTFAGGVFCHSFLGPNDYHRQHTPVSGIVREARFIEGLCCLQVTVEKDDNEKLTIKPHRRLSGAPLKVPAQAGDGKGIMEAPDDPGYQFIQARALILIETKDIGLVAVLPIGMAHVSSVDLSVEVGDEVKKGDEISCFQFGGSDIVMVFQEKAKVEFTAKAEDHQHYNFGKELARSKVYPDV